MTLRPFLVTALIAATTATPLRQPSPQSIANELLAADRAFAAAAATTNLVEALDAMFADEVRMPIAQGEWARGRAAVRDALRATPGNADAKVDWSPVRAGISADGRHGFTYGFMTVRRGELPPLPGKYLAYWVKGPAGWRVVAYKRAAGAAGEVQRTSMPSLLPEALVAPVQDAAVVRQHRESLVAAERAFSDLANDVGLGHAFARTGARDAMNMGGGSADFVIGNEAIAKSVSGARPMEAKPFTWGADDAIVASSGDLGITFGQIHQNGAAAGAPSFSFFTIWRRESPSAPWKYVAE